MTSTEIVKALASGPRPDWGGVTAPDAESRLEQYWNDLLQLAEVGSWRSVVAISGQLVEALLKHRLLHAGERETARLTMGQLIDFAHRKGVLGSKDLPLLANSTLSAALILRNWASHYSIYGRNPDALQAAQAMVALIAASQILFSVDSRVQDTEFSSKSYKISKVDSPFVAVASLKKLDTRDLADLLATRGEELADYFARNGPPSAITQFEEVVRPYPSATSFLRQALARHFGRIVRNATYTSFRKLAGLSLALRRLGLGEHATALGILLPSDPEFLINLLKSQAPASATMYWTECFKSSREIISARFGNPRKRAKLVSEFWPAVKIGRGSIVSLANLLRMLPAFVSTELLKIAPIEEIIKWIELSGPAGSTNLLPLFNPERVAREPYLSDLRDKVVTTIADNIAGAPATSLGPLPLRLYKMKAVDPPRSTKILKAALKSSASSRDWHAVRRVVWDSYSFFPHMQRDAVDVAKRMLSSDPFSIPVWERACLLGLLALAGEAPTGAQFFAQDDQLCLPLSLPAETDRWQGFLFSLGAAKFGTDSFRQNVPSGLISSITALATNTTGGTPTSVSLVTAAREATISLESRG